MSINQEVYGAPETWQYSFINGGLETDAAKALKIQKAKVPTWDPDNNPGYWTSQLREGITAGKLTKNVPIDKTVCAVGMGKDCPFAEMGYFRRVVREGTTGDVGLDSIVRVGDGVVNGFLWDMRDDASAGTYNLLSAGGGQIDEKQMTYRTWAPSSDNERNTSKQNGNYFIAPYTYYQLKTFIITIQVFVCNSADVPDNPEDITQVPTATWRSLDDWKNNYPTHKIIGLRASFARANSILDSGGRITYTRPSPPSQYDYSVMCGFGILDELSFDQELQYKVYDYALFADGDSWNTTIFKPFTDTVWSNSVHRIAFFGMYNVFSTYLKYLPGAVWYQIPYSEEIYDSICRAIATFGFIFITDGTLTLPSAMNTDNICFPVIDDNGIANGDYTRGADNLNNDIYNADSTRDKDYDPTVPPAPIPDINPILPEGLQFTLAGRGTGIWALTPSEIDQVWSDVFGSGVKPTMFGNNPMNAILSLKWTPFIWDPSGTDPYSPIVLGDTAVNELHEYPVINTVSTSERHAFGSVKFQFDKNFFNARYMQARLFLPFYGYYALPTAQLLSSTLRVDFYYNVPDELGVYIICYDDVVYDYVECCCDMEVPLTGSNAAAISSSKRSEALSIATQVGAAAATAIMGASAIKALGTGLSNIAVAGYEGAWGYGGGIKGFIGAAKDNIGILAEEGFINPRGMAKGGAALGGLGAVGGGISNTIYKANVERAALKTNLPYHGSALQTTFLHMSMVPYVQIFRNAIMEGLESTSGVDRTLSGNSEAQYKLKVGHACDVWTTINAMPENSLLQATGIADSTVVNMEIAEVQELNGILQTGFYK